MTVYYMLNKQKKHMDVKFFIHNKYYPHVSKFFIMIMHWSPKILLSFWLSCRITV